MHRKGFTLVELLMVMVLVGILVTAALPAYKAAMEKGRAMEGIGNAAALSEAANVSYVKNVGSYAKAAEDTSWAGVTLSRMFDTPSISVNGDTLTVTLPRKTGAYSIVFTSEGGEVTSRVCQAASTQGQRYCKAMGAKCNGNTCTF